MFGGLKKSASRLALVAAAGALSTGAYAADLGGDCCADLEERVAELEATTARKGNRKVSLTISGQVNRTLMYWNDGGRSNTHFGLDNTNSSSRFSLSGNAKITPTVTAGFSLVIDAFGQSRSVNVSQHQDDGTSQFRSQNANGDHQLRLRDANWWLESSQLGRITMGRITTSGPTGTLDLGGVGVVATAGESCIGSALKFRNATTGILTALDIQTASASCAHPLFRAEGIKYTSPTFAGFTFDAHIGEAAKVERNPENGAYNASTGGGAIGTNYGTSLRYAGEFSGVRLAGSLGYERSNGNDDDSGFNFDSIYSSWGAALSLLHVPTGLFVQGEYIAAKVEYANPAATGSPLVGTSNEANRWHVQAGVRQNWFGIGATSVYGEYGVHTNWARMNSGGAIANIAGSGGSAGFPGGAVDSDKLRIWGLGLVQEIDAASMQLYLGYRNYKADLTSAGIPINFSSIDVIAAGARIRF